MKPEQIHLLSLESKSELTNSKDPLNFILDHLKNPNCSAFFKLPLRLLPGAGRNGKTMCVCTLFKYLTPGLFNGSEIKDLRSKLNQLKETEFASAEACANEVMKIIKAAIQEQIEYPEGDLFLEPATLKNSTFAWFLHELHQQLGEKFVSGYKRPSGERWDNDSQTNYYITPTPLVHM